MKMRGHLLTIFIMLGIMSLLPVFLHGNLTIMHILIISLIYAVVVAAWDLIMGYAGVFSFATVAFFVIGGYSSGILTLRFGISPWLAIFAAGCITSGVGIIIGLACLRLKPAYVALITFALHMMLEPLIKSNAGRMIGTGGTRGLLGIPPLAVGGYTFSYFERVPWFYAALGIWFVSIFIIYKIIHSSWGLAFVAVRDSEPLAISFGINDFRYKLTVFGISACLTGIIGAFYAHYVGLLSPRLLGLDFFLLLMVMLVMGGMGRFPGAVIGAFVATFANTYLLVVGAYRLVILGAIVVAVTILMPDGLMGTFSRIRDRRQSTVAFGTSKRT